MILRGNFDLRAPSAVNSEIGERPVCPQVCPALRVSAVAGIVATEWGMGEPQKVASNLSGGWTDDPAEKAEALRARGKATAGPDFSEPGVGVGFRA
jgi:hypothetical protein